MQVRYSLVVLYKDGSTRQYSVGEHPITVGRLPTSTIRLDDSPVSRQHCVFIPTGGGLTVLDQGSTNGTFINGFRRQHARLQHGDEIRIGKTKLKVEAETEKRRPSPTKSSKSTPPPTVSCPTQAEDQLAYLMSFDRRLVKATDTQSARALVLSAVIETFPVQRAMIVVQTPLDDTGRLQALDVRCTEKSSLPSDVLNRKLVKKVMRTGKPEKIFSKKGAAFPEQSQSSQHVWGSALCAPMWNDGRVIGALYADSLTSNAIFDRPEVLSLFAAMACSASLVIKPTVAPTIEMDAIADMKPRNGLAQEELTQPDGVQLSSATRRIEEQRIKLAERLVQMEHIERARSTLSRGLVHDIKNLVGALNSNHSFIKESLADGSDELEAMDDAIEISRRIVTMAEDMLALSRMEDGSFPLSTRVVNVQQLLARTHRRHSTHAREQAVSLALGPVEEGLEAIIDPSVVDRMLDNLVGNALRHAGEDGWVILSATALGEQAKIVVADSGPSIPPDERDRVFTEWYCAESNQSSHHGIGLYFCRVAAEAHGGSVRIEGTPGDNHVIVLLPAPPIEGNEISTQIIVPSHRKTEIPDS